MAPVAFALACAVQLYGLYAPQAPGPPGPAGADKVAHTAMFAAVLVTGSLVRIPLAPLTAVLGVHAVVSEVVQHRLLPDRSGDPADVVADLVGVALGVGVVLAARRARAARRASSTHGPAAPGPGAGADS